MELFEVAGRRYTIERAAPVDVRAIAALLADDTLGAARESDDLETYEKAFREIDADAHRFYERLGYAATHDGFKLPL